MAKKLMPVQENHYTKVIVQWLNYGILKLYIVIFPCAGRPVHSTQIQAFNSYYEFQVSIPKPLD